MNQDIPIWKKVVYPILVLLAVPIVSIITLFTIPLLAGGPNPTSTRDVVSDILMFLFATFATYYLIVFIAKIAKPQSRWKFVNFVFWGYIAISVIASFLYYSGAIGLIFSTVHMLSFNVIVDIFKGNISSADYLNGLLWIASPFVIYYLIRRKFKHTNNT